MAIRFDLKVQKFSILNNLKTLMGKLKVTHFELLSAENIVEEYSDHFPVYGLFSIHS